MLRGVGAISRPDRAEPCRNAFTNDVPILELDSSRLHLGDPPFGFVEPGLVGICVGRAIEALQQLASKASTLIAREAERLGTEVFCRGHRASLARRGRVCDWRASPQRDPANTDGDGLEVRLKRGAQLPPAPTAWGAERRCQRRLWR